MADTKISELPVATAIASPDVAPIVQSGVTKQADVSLFNNLVASLMLRSSGDSNHPVTLPYTPDNSGIIVKDVNGAEVFSLWGDFYHQSCFFGSSAGLNSSGDKNIAIGFQALSAGDISGSNTAVGFKALLVFTGGLGGFNTTIGESSGLGLIDGANNTFIGALASANAVHTNQAVSIGSNSDAVSDASVAIGANATVTGNNGIAIGWSAFALHDNTITIGVSLSPSGNDEILIGGDSGAGAHTVTVGSDTVTDFYAGALGNAILHGKGDAIVFPDSDPHIVGAGYWLAGVLTRSAG